MATEATARRAEGHKHLKRDGIDRGEQVIEAATLWSHRSREPGERLLFKATSRLPACAVHDPPDRTHLPLHQPHKLAHSNGIGDVASLVASRDASGHKRHH